MSGTSQQRFGDSMQAIDLLARIVAFTDPFAAPDTNFKNAINSQEPNRKAAVAMMTSLLRAFKGGRPCLNDVNPTSTSPGYFYTNQSLAEHATYEAVRIAFGYSATKTFEEVIEALSSVLGASSVPQVSVQDTKKVQHFLVAWRDEARKMMLDQLAEASRNPSENPIPSEFFSQSVTV